MSQETIARILAIEEEAVSIHDDAQRRARRLIEEAQKEAAALHSQALAQARQQVQEIVAQGQEEAGAERARIIAQAEAEAERMETTAAQHLARAVRFVLQQVAGRG